MKKIVLAMLLITSLHELSAQGTASYLTEKFNAYQELFPKLKLHMIFNQDKYVAGDTAYFKAYFLKENLSGVAGSQLIELNLVDSQGKSKLHFSFKILNGVGQNQMAVPATLPPGIYLVTAHSSWMKNFTPLPFFRKEITIVNKNVILSDARHSIKAAVEGGHLIRDINNTIIVRTWRSGKSVKIVSSTAKVVAKTTTNLCGVGSLSFIPLRNESYHVSDDHDSIKSPLPIVEDDGCSLHFTQPRLEDPVTLTLASPKDSPLRREELIVAASCRGKIIYTGSLIMGSKEVSDIQLAQNDLPEGIVHVSILRGSSLIASRDFYSPAKNNVEARMQIGKTSYQPREKATIEVAITDKQGNPTEGEVSIKVLHDWLFDLKNQNSLADEVELPFDPFKRYVLDKSVPNWLKELNSYLGSVTEEVPWRAILTNELSKPRFTLSNFLQKSGKAYFAETHEPIPEEANIAFYLQHSKIMYQTTVEKGKVWLALPDLFGPDEMFYYGETFYYQSGARHGEAIANLKIEWDDEYIELPRAPTWQETTTLDPYASFANKRNMINRSYGFYTTSRPSKTDQKALSARNIATTNEADVTINVPSYTIFPTMAELIQEVIPALQHRKYNGKDIVLVSLFESMNLEATGDPLYIIDGVATKNTEFFLSLKPVDLLEVKIVFDPKKLFRYHLLGKNGIVIVNTKDGDVREPLDDPTKIIEGLNKPVAFVTLNNNDVHTPDFKSTIYWNPMVKTDAAGKALIEFNSTDDVGVFSIQVDGRSKDGELFSTTAKLFIGH